MVLSSMPIFLLYLHVFAGVFGAFISHGLPAFGLGKDAGLAQEKNI